MKYYSMNVDEVLKSLNSSSNGLSSVDARERLVLEGKNKIVSSKKVSKFVLFINQFKDIMIIILILSAIVSFVLSLINGESFIDSIIIIFIVLLNGVLGFIQEVNAESAIDALRNMQVSKVNVKRDGVLSTINSEDLVRGDVVVLEAGDVACCDSRVIWEASLKVNESSLTGESTYVSKSSDVIDENAILSMRSNMVYSGTSVVYGRCCVVVCETGMNTEVGKIANYIDEEKKEITPLQVKINSISKVLSIIILVIIVIMFIIGLIKKMKIMEIIMLSISLAVAAIPEGLVAVITITLYLSISEMARKNAIVRKMSSVETLGSTEVICTDKTGTITQNKMKVREVYFDNCICSYKDLGSDNILLSIMALNNDVNKNGDEFIGDPTEVALYEACLECFDVDKFKNDNVRVDELPFDSDRKMMSVISKCDGNIRLYSKGSFDSIIKCCSYIYEDNSIIKLSEDKIRKLEDVSSTESNKSYRVLAYAYKEIDSDYVLESSLESDLVFAGLTSMSDPPRVGVRDAILECRKAHIKPVMITGDSLDTATSIAREIGILDDDDLAISGEVLDKMSSDDFDNSIDKYSVFARVSPVNKLDIVNAWKKRGKIVAMTGDGVNDAPALKCADIGVGMGIAGTEVSKGVSDIVLADDSFSTIVTAVKEGRRIFDNIRNILVYLLTGNIAEVLVVFIGMLFGTEIFLPIQLLFINLITDSIPSICLAFEESDDNIMMRDVRRNNNSFFTPFLVAKIGLSSLLKTCVIMGIYYISYLLYSSFVASSMAFLSLTLTEMTFAFSCRNLKKNVICIGLFSNRRLNIGMLILSFVQVIVFVTPLRSVFGIANLSLIQFVYCLVVVILIFVIDELSKKFISICFRD